MRSTTRRPLGLAQAALLSAVAFLGSGSALAQSGAQAANGIMQFKNARMEQATPQQIEQLSRIVGTAGMRAYVDPATGELRDQTPEEAAGAATKSATAFRSFKSVVSASPFGGLIAEVDDDTFMVNNVVTRDASGKLRMQCVTGAEGIGAPLRGAGKEHGHAH